MRLPPLCPLHGEHPELACPECDAAAARWQAVLDEEARRAPPPQPRKPSKGPSDLENAFFLFKRFVLRYPDPAGYILGLACAVAGYGVLVLLDRVVPGLDAKNNFFLQCAVWTAPFWVLLIYQRWRNRDD